MTGAGGRLSRVDPTIFYSHCMMTMESWLECWLLILTILTRGGHKGSDRLRSNMQDSASMWKEREPKWLQVFGPGTVSYRWRNRPLALRGHVTNASLKQWVVILLLPKIDRTHKNYLTHEIWEKTHLREIFYGTLIFQQNSTICLGRHVGGHTLAVQHGGQNYFLLISC